MLKEVNLPVLYFKLHPECFQFTSPHDSSVNELYRSLGSAPLDPLDRHTDELGSSVPSPRCCNVMFSPDLTDMLCLGETKKSSCIVNSPVNCCEAGAACCLNCCEAGAAC